MRCAFQVITSRSCLPRLVHAKSYRHHALTSQATFPSAPWVPLNFMRIENQMVYSHVPSRSAENMLFNKNPVWRKNKCYWNLRLLEKETAGELQFDLQTGWKSSQLEPVGKPRKKPMSLLMLFPLPTLSCCAFLCASLPVVRLFFSSGFIFNSVSAKYDVGIGAMHHPVKSIWYVLVQLPENEGCSN